MQTLLLGVERGMFPPADAGLTLLPQSDVRHAAVLGFTAHIVVVADVGESWLAAHLLPGQLSEAFTPPFLGSIASHLGRRVPAIDLVLLAEPADGPPGLALTAQTDPVGRRSSRGVGRFAGGLATDPDHPRVRRALRYRDDVKVWTAPGGILILGRGLAGRWEVAIEVDEAHRGQGLGRRLAAAARYLVPDGRSVWAQVAPGNAASVRAFYAAGYHAVGQEAQLVTH